jgi:hypothetical protein
LAGPIILSTLIFKVSLPEEATAALQNEYIVRHTDGDDTISTEYGILEA